MKIFNLSIIITICILSITVNSAYGQAGSLDNSFSSNGKVLTQFGAYFDVANAVVVQTNGKIVVAGTSTYDDNTGYGHIAVARFNADGSLDNTFSGDGKVITTIATDDEGRAVAVQGDGKIVVGGSTYNSGSSKTNFVLLRYNVDGSPDVGFNSTGTVVASVTSGIDEINGVAIQPDGMIVVTGMAGGNDFLVARYTSSGILDNTFNGQGWVTTDFSGGGDEAYAVTLQPNGKILAAGRAFIGGGNNFAIARYNTDGTLDNNFSGNGKADTYIGITNSEAWAMDLLPDGKILLAGYGIVGGNNDFALAKFNADGTLDVNFSNDGKHNIDLGGGEDDEANCIRVQADGKILVAGYATTFSGYSFAMVRLNADGSSDNSFGSGGKVFTTIEGGVDDRAFGMALQTDGKIVVTGYGSNSADDYGFALARYHPTPQSGIESLDIYNNKISVFPMPAASVLNVNYSLNSETSVSLQILDLQGRQVLSFEGQVKNPGNHSETLGLQNLAPGIYSLIITFGTEQRSFKVVH